MSFPLPFSRELTQAGTPDLICPKSGNHIEKRRFLLEFTPYLIRGKNDKKRRR
jgi:hypothetical protein